MNSYTNHTHLHLPIIGSIEYLVLVSLGKIACTLVFNLLYVYTVELYPTVVRAVASSTGNFFARLASIIAPVIAQLVRNTSHQCAGSDVTVPRRCRVTSTQPPLSSSLACVRSSPASARSHFRKLSTFLSATQFLTPVTALSTISKHGHTVYAFHLNRV